MVALVLSLLWRQIGSINELVRVVHTEAVVGAMVGAPLRDLTQQALAQRLRTLPAELFARVLQTILPVLHSRWPAAAASAPPPAQAARPTKVMEQGALDLVKKMSAKLAATPAFVVRTRSSTEAPGGTGQFLTFFTESVVAVQRPNKLSAEIRGDAPPFDFYFDGAKMTAYEPTHKLYATADAPKTLDELVPFAAKTAGLLLPFADILYSDPYASPDQGSDQRLLRRLLRHARRPLRACRAGRAGH